MATTVPAVKQALVQALIAAVLADIRSADGRRPAA